MIRATASDVERHFHDKRHAVGHTERHVTILPGPEQRPARSAVEERARPELEVERAPELEPGVELAPAVALQAA